MRLSEPARSEVPSDDWLRPVIEVEGLARHVEVIRSRLWMIALTLLATLAGAGFYLARAENVYQADADLTVTPAPTDGGAPPLGLGLIRESADPTRDVATVARLVTTESVAARVREALNLRSSPRSLLASTEATPVAATSIVQVTAKSTDPRAAQRLANGFAQALIDERTDRLHQQLDTLISRLTARIGHVGRSNPTLRDTLNGQLSTLAELRDSPDPTLRLETPAALPNSPVSPRRTLTIVAAIVSGLVLGIGGILTLQLLDPRLRREQQLRELYRLPVLARIARKRGRNPDPVLPDDMPRAMVDGYDGLGAALTAGRGDFTGQRTVLVTGASASEGKTTTAINLAFSLARAGNSVILIETDIRRASIGRTVGVTPSFGLTDTIEGGVELEDSLVTIGNSDSRVRALLTSRTDRAERAFAMAAVHHLLEQAEQIASFVVIDSPPLHRVPNVVQIASLVDDVVLVARIGQTNLNQLNELTEFLAQQRIRPAGFALLGVPTQRAYD